MRLFTDHPESVGETYFQHLLMALSFSVRLAGAAVAALVHAFLPFLFVKTGSKIITCLHDEMVTHRNRSTSNSGVTGLTHTATE